ncbi:MAG: SMC-Scp complex subunit ScpB [Eubacteriaceae bacterium]
MTEKELKAIIESLLFSVGEAISLQEISETLELNHSETKELILSLKDEYDYESRGIQINQINSKFQMCTRPEYYSYINKIMTERNTSGLSQAALETLAIIAYKQPVTRVEVELLRGVKTSSSVQTLIDRNLIKEAGRLDSPGKPIVYETTFEFLRYLGLTSIKELPSYEEFLEGIQEQINTVDKS